MRKQTQNPNHRCQTCRSTIKASDKHTLCVRCLGDEHFVGLGDRVCEDCLGLKKGTYRRRIRHWANRQSLRFAAMVDEQEGGESSQVESLTSSQSQSQSQRGRSMGSSGASSRSRAPSRTQSRAQTKFEVELSEGDDDFLSIYVAEPEGMVSEKQK